MPHGLRDPFKNKGTLFMWNFWGSGYSSMSKKISVVHLQVLQDPLDNNTTLTLQGTYRLIGPYNPKQRPAINLLLGYEVS